MLPAWAPWWLRRRLQAPGLERPYTNEEVRSLECFRCGAPGEQQWQICADGNVWRVLCTPCDVGMNALVLAYVEHPDAVELLAAYEERMLLG